MHPSPTKLAVHSRSRFRWAGLLCLALFFALELFAASADLHQSIHPDAHHSGHHCPVTLLTHGQLHSPSLLALVAGFIPALSMVMPRIFYVVLSFSDLRLDPGRAPPCF